MNRLYKIMILQIYQRKMDTITTHKIQQMIYYSNDLPVYSNGNKLSQ